MGHGMDEGVVGLDSKLDSNCGRRYYADSIGESENL